MADRDLVKAQAVAAELTAAGRADAAGTKEALVAVHPIGRLGTAEKVAHLVLVLLSDKATFISGSCHLVDGGYTAQ